MSDPFEPHPLDDVAFEDPPRIEHRRAQAHQLVLKRSIAVLLVSFGVLVVSAIAGSTALPNSTLETVSSLVNQLSRIALLGGFLGILIAYRLPYLQRMFSLTRESAPTKAEAPASPSFARFLRSNGFVTLILANAIAFVVLSGLTSLEIALSGRRGGFFGPPLLIITLPCFAVGLMITMIVWHSNYLRAYAIGVLSSFPVFVFFLEMVGSRGASGAIASTMIAIGVPLLVGLACAGYVHVLTMLRVPEQ